jgi:hypothetical protein
MDCREAWEVMMEQITPKQQFIAELKQTWDRIDQIDREVPWTDSEPLWWSTMMCFRRTVLKTLQAVDTD